MVFKEQDMIIREANVMNRTYTARRLTPHTNYTFRVAGVNSRGRGPYSNDITALTNQDGIKLYNN